MARVTSKLQVSIPKTFADQLGIEPGDEIHWSLSGNSLRIRQDGGSGEDEGLIRERLRLFDQATARLRRRRQRSPGRAPSDRGWTREELYRRGRSR